jgi:hypothetical protein
MFIPQMEQIAAVGKTHQNKTIAEIKNRFESFRRARFKFNDQSNVEINTK